MTNKATPHQ